MNVFTRDKHVRTMQIANSKRLGYLLICSPTCRNCINVMINDKKWNRARLYIFRLFLVHSADRYKLLFFYCDRSLIIIRDIVRRDILASKQLNTMLLQTNCDLIFLGLVVERKGGVRCAVALHVDCIFSMYNLQTL